MKKQTVKTRFKGGWILRDAHTGRIVQVSTKSGVTKSTTKTENTIVKVSSKRNEAMRRLVNR